MIAIEDVQAHSTMPYTASAMSRVMMVFQPTTLKMDLRGKNTAAAAAAAVTG
jgi:hypothetical protein